MQTAHAALVTAMECKLTIQESLDSPFTFSFHHIRLLHSIYHRSTWIGYWIYTIFYTHSFYNFLELSNIWVWRCWCFAVCSILALAIAMRSLCRLCCCRSLRFHVKKRRFQKAVFRTTNVLASKTSCCLSVFSRPKMMYFLSNFKGGQRQGVSDHRWTMPCLRILMVSVLVENEISVSKRSMVIWVAYCWWWPIKVGSLSPFLSVLEPVRSCTEVKRHTYFSSQWTYREY